jgi:hypothetical protein
MPGFLHFIAAPAVLPLFRLIRIEFGVRQYFTEEPLYLQLPLSSFFLDGERAILA